MPPLPIRAALLITLWFAAAISAAASDTGVVGFVEEVVVHPGALKLMAKVDTGALNCSLHAERIKVFRRQGMQWVRFQTRNQQGRPFSMERRLVRIARIRRHKGKYQTRPVVHLGICLGPRYREVEVNLIDRSGFKYRMLVGRSYLAGIFLVDPAEMFINPPSCTRVTRHE